ncbi:MAG: hypothetical protein NTU43_06005, partial [Bacteroidetes bacterium]|nr:hypothetical protein [Bacteroidota bacterium]
RKFLQFLGLSAGASMISNSVMAGYIDKNEILKLNPEQQDFMIEYGKWMDEYVNVIKIQNTDRDDMENNLKMIKLTEQAEIWQPKLTEYMKDRKFAIIYLTSIEKMKAEITN